MNNITLRKDQKRLIKNTLEALKTHQRVIMQSPVGTGKTAMGAAVVKALKLPTLWLAHRKELIEQAQAVAPRVSTMTVIILSIEKRAEVSRPGIFLCMESVMKIYRRLKQNRWELLARVEQLSARAFKRFYARNSEVSKKRWYRLLSYELTLRDAIKETEE